MKLKILTCISGALLLIVVALYFGYPLVTSDTSAYISVGFDFNMPLDRSPFYGSFLRHSSLATSLWYTIFAQSLIVSFLLIRYIKLIYNAEPGIQQILLNLFLVTAGTCVSWISSYLMPDIFGSILLLSILLFILGKDHGKVNNIIYLIIITAATLTHNSHVIILGLFSGLLLFYNLFRKDRRYIVKSISLLSISIGTFLFMCTLNKIEHDKFTYSRGSHVFMMGKLSETGVLSAYLNDNCGKKNFSLCNYRDQLPNSSMGFLWLGDSPLYKTGGWDNSFVEYNAIINDVFTTPKYASMFFFKSITSTLRQLTQVQVSHGSEQTQYVTDQVNRNFSSEIQEFKSGLQFTGAKDTAVYNKLYLLVLILSSIGVIALYSRFTDKQFIMILYGLLLCFIVCNAYVTATFANVLDRLNTKVFWLLPATNLVILARYWSGKPSVEAKNQ